MILKDNTMACCGLKVELSPRGVKRVVEPEQIRRGISASDKRAKLNEQENKCAYCERGFGEYVFYKNKQRKLKIHWDHFVPYSYNQDNTSTNYLAACNLCNLWKTNLIFQTLDEVKIFVRMKIETDERRYAPIVEPDSM